MSVQHQPSGTAGSSATTATAVRCLACGGTGIRSYPHKGTFRFPHGERVPTPDICDVCWGTGDDSHPDLSRRHRLLMGTLP